MAGLKKDNQELKEWLKFYSVILSGRMRDLWVGASSKFEEVLLPINAKSYDDGDSNRYRKF